MQREYIRELARQVAQIAASPENEIIHRRWRDVNAMRKADRAPVYCRPIGAWSELLPEESLKCSDPWLRSVEIGFRRILIKHEIGDDDPVEPYFPVWATLECDPRNIYGVDIGRHKSSESGGAWGYDPPLKSEADLDKLVLPHYTFNEQRTQEALSKAHELLGDILPVEMICHSPEEPNVACTAANLLGLTEYMMNMAVAPEMLHRLMAFIRDASLKTMDDVEQTGRLTPNNTGAMLCSDPFGPEPTDGKLTLKNQWIMANSQECDQVSPAMWEEFCLQYQMPIMERYGLTAYGCCENLTHKIDGVLSIPNLRIFVCSAWSDLSKIIERAADRHVIMWRQKASAVVFPNDSETIRRELTEGAQKLQGCHYQIVLRELQTLAGHPDRLHIWTRYAKEAAEKYA